MNKIEPTLAAMTYSERMAYYAALIAETAAMLARHRARMEREPRWVAPEDCPF